MDLNIPLGSGSDLIAGAASVFAAIVTGLLARQKMSENKAQARLEDARVETETDIVSHLQSQRDYSMNESKESKRLQIVAEYENRESKTRVGVLEAELVSLRARVQLLSQLVTRLTTALDLTKSQLNIIIQKSTAQTTPLDSQTSHT